LEQALGENVVEPKVPGSEQECDRLNDDHRLAGDLPGYAQSRLSQESTARHSEITVSFPSDNLAQTTMGNVARSVASYARQRYGMDLDFMWTRLQKVMEGDDHYRTLMEAQIRVDFVVSMFWLLAFSLVLWIPCYAATGTNPLVFLTLMVGTPFVLAALYKLCTESYRAFADLLRSAVDLFRFQLLGELRLPLPADGAQERRLWTMVNRQMAFGETQNLPYVHDRGSR
ncbi:MAG: hypothetical protein GWN02_07820, partial [Gemmatimonadetes bacterium]|nr:hypothetical protein [Actinomycetota bacterium]NIY08184.1 hypothetical protein [Gemmatimonadota bacterium]NIT97331.1 hypothetical protein [Actinomycetota bacterium]NIU69012.1 hypothetical protein [Actinomycetota bacterium]NIV89051.1 hypothetical protein [Actinomycetota bacterium]